MEWPAHQESTLVEMYDDFYGIMLSQWSMYFYNIHRLQLLPPSRKLLDLVQPSTC